MPPRTASSSPPRLRGAPGLALPAAAVSLIVVLCAPGSRAAEPCEAVGARIVSLQGQVEVQAEGGAEWRPLELDGTLCVGDTIRVGALSRAALELPDNPNLRLDQLTTLRIVGTTETGASWLDVLFGALHAISRQPHTLRLDTPVATAGTEGTEFLIRVAEGRTEVVMLEGRVRLTTPDGELLVASGEAVLAQAGAPPAAQIVARPRDAVAWTLYYPPLLAPLATHGAAPAALPAGLERAIGRVAADDFAGAIAALDAEPAAERDARYFTYRAGVLLNVGQAAAAEAALASALALEPDASAALAQRAVLRVVQNRREAALADARRAVELDPAAAPARLALSYALQAGFELEAARATLREAARRTPEDPLVWARLAELEQSFGALGEAQVAAERAAALAPELARTQMVLGFAALARIDIGRARAAFERAIALDSAEPLARLGLGLAKIRAGDLDAGGRDLAIAVSLDPNSSLLRSYLGKAYFEERRGPLDAEQFRIAKELDPNDPTPWFYDAIRLQTENCPVEALRSLEMSIALNDDRAPYRSRLLLDEDRATRGTSLARIYDDLGFEQLGINEATQALTLDPANSSAHRFLSDLYLGRPRLEAARVSELLQAQLLQPVGRNPIQPSLAFADLDIVAAAGPARPGFNEFTPLFTRNGVQLDATGVLGTDSTYGDELVATALAGRTSISAGQLHYQTDGFRDNNDLQHDIYTLFGQSDLTESLSLQAEYRHRDTDRGDRARLFDPEDFDPRRRDHLEEDVYRLGGRLTPRPGQVGLVSAIYTDREDQINTVQDFFGRTEARTKTEIGQLEGQYQGSFGALRLVGGGGFANVDAETRFSEQTGSFAIEQRPDETAANVYLTASMPLAPTVELTARVGYARVDLKLKDDVGGGEDQTEMSGATPALGVTWQASDAVRLRLAAGRRIKQPYVANQTLQPTTIAGFNEQFDEFDGTRADWVGVGADVRASATVRVGAEMILRRLARERSAQNADADVVHFDDRRDDNRALAYVYWTPTDRIAGSLEVIAERYSARQKDDPPDDVESWTTLTVPLRLSYTLPSGWFAIGQASFVAQDVDLVDDGPSGNKVDDSDDHGVLVDLTAGYRLPRRRGVIALEVTNLFDQHLSFRDEGFQTSREELNPRFLPSRAFLGTITLNF